MSRPLEINPNINSRPIDPGQLAYADNPQPRCPVVLLLDCSASMEGEPMAELNNALAQFGRELAADPVAAASVELGVIVFGSAVEALRRFGPPGEFQHPPRLTASGRTPLGAALRLALSEIGERRAFYKRQGLSAYKPWLVIMSDGQPNDDWIAAASDALTLAKAGRLVLIGVGIGPHVDMVTLRRIAGDDPGPFRMEGLRFGNFFRWLGDSLHTVANTPSPGQRAIIPNPADYDWTV